MRKIIVAIFLVLTFLCSPAMSITAANWFNYALELWDGEKYTDPGKAIEYLNNALQLEPDSALAYNSRGIAYRNLHQYQMAIKDFNVAIRLKPDYAVFYNNRGLSYVSLRQYQLAIKDYNEAIRLNPDYAVAYYNKACLLALQKDAIQSCNSLRLAMERGFNDSKHIQEDKDFDNVRNTACFIDILNKYGK
ncbi:MAG: hypothetical protein CVU62_08585 [Deltaproteobacteria bacterium HGW-Deltaproteobacteria-2]|jgi:tetratricopeptide (TPR) repeat protein|nr:MAG: hypothetical protein CVU62_08585 [Deltaproteobacteria bacterium HGW-Deltaproteobacteria-2]